MATNFTNNSLGAVGLYDAPTGHVVASAIGGRVVAEPDYYSAQIIQIYTDAGLGAAVEGDPPVNDVVPAITGAATVGVTMSSDSGDWSGDGSIGYAYQWQSSETGSGDWVDIEGENTDELELIADWVGEYVRCVVTASSIFGSATAATEPAGPIANE